MALFVYCTVSCYPYQATLRRYPIVLFQQCCILSRLLHGQFRHCWRLYVVVWNSPSGNI